MAHRVTEWTEVTQCYWGADDTKRNGRNGDKRNITEVCRWHKEWRRYSVQILDNYFWGKYFVYKLLTNLTIKLLCSTHRWCLRDFRCIVLIILRPLRFSVWYYVKFLILRSKCSHYKLLNTLFFLKKIITCFGSVIFLITLQYYF